MAALMHQSFSDTEDFEDNYASDSPNDNLFRPTIADQLKIGFFSLDRATQTDKSEIIDLKEMTDVIQQLMKDASSMQRDINFARHVMKAEFEQKLQEKSIELYVRVNDRLGELEKANEDRVSTVRRAFKQQLSDAIARMHTYYTRDFAERMQKEKQQKAAETLKYEQKYKEMQSTLQRNDSIIHMLKMQVAQYQKDEGGWLGFVDLHGEDLYNYLLTLEQPEEKSPTPEVRYARSPGVIQELEDLHDEIERLKQENSKLQDSLSSSSGKNLETKKEIFSLKEQLETQKAFVQQLQMEKEEFQASSMKDKASAEKQFEAQKLEMEKRMEERIRKVRDEAMAEARREVEKMNDSGNAKIQEMMEEKKRLEHKLAMEQSKAREKTQQEIDVERAQKNEARLMFEIGQLKKEIEKIHRTWEKKFSILQKSLHALKDESYLRQTLQRQSATLHQASVSYAYDMPMGISPNRKVNRVKPLPGINRHGKPALAEYLSYTVSAASGRATDLFSREPDEHQIMSDDCEDLPPGVIPIPSPPPRPSTTGCGGEDSRPSTRSHVVVLPTVQAN